MGKPFTKSKFAKRASAAIGFGTNILALVFILMSITNDETARIERRLSSYKGFIASMKQRGCKQVEVIHDGARGYPIKAHFNCAGGIERWKP